MLETTAAESGGFEAKASNVIRHHDQVMRLAIASHDIIGEQCLWLKAELFEDMKGAALAAGHTRDALLQAALPGLGKELIGKQVAETVAAHRRADQELNFAQVTAPV